MDENLEGWFFGGSFVVAKELSRCSKTAPYKDKWIIYAKTPTQEWLLPISGTVS